MKNSALILASLAADSLALGPHWVYDTAVIDAQFGRIATLQQPLPDSYHKTKNRGDFTHYGDQALLLLQSVAEHGEFNLQKFAVDWQKMMSNYAGYVDGATRKTLENLAAGKSPEACGSASSDLGGAARIAAIVYRYQHDWERLVSMAEQQTRFTHNNSRVVAGARGLAKICWQVLQGQKPSEAVKNLAADGVGDIDLDMRLQNSIGSATMPTREVVAEFGQACGIGSGLPGVCHLIMKYEDDLKTALIENVMAGGDSAARGLCVGMVLGAYLGPEAIPADWLQSLARYEHLVELIEKIDRIMP